MVKEIKNHEGWPGVFLQSHRDFRFNDLFLKFAFSRIPLDNTSKK